MKTFTILAFCILCTAAGAAEGIRVGPETIVMENGPGKGTRATPAVAFGGRVYLVVWREGWHGKGGGARIYAARVDKAGKVLDPKGIQVAPCKTGVQTRPRVAFANNIFLVVWQDFRNGRDYDVLAARVSPEGKVLDTRPIAVAVEPRTQALPDVASDGTAFVVVWQGLRGKATGYSGFAVRVGADGRVGTVFQNHARPQPRIAWGGRSYLVVFGTKSLYSLQLGPDGKGLHPNRKPWDGMVVRSSKHPDFSVTAVPGRGWLVVNHRSPPDPWGWGGPGAMRCYLMKPDGKRDSGIKKEPSGNWSKLPNWLDLGGRERKTWPYGANACAWDGRHAVVVWQRYHITGEKRSHFRNCDLLAARVDGWKPVDARGVPVAAGPEDEKMPALASDGAGGLLCVFEKYGKDRKVRIVARTLRTRDRTNNE